MSSLDAGELAAALPAANLAVLIAAVAHLTGDLSMVDAHGEPRTFDHGRGPGSVTDVDADAIRAWAFDALTTLPAGAGSGATGRRPEVAELHRLLEFVVGEPVGAEYVPLVEEEADFDGADPRRFEWTERPGADALAGFHVGVIGAGLGGLCAAIRLEQAGIPYTVFDKNTDVGGTWFENTYPDLRVDVPNHFYSYSFRPNPAWSHYYARQHELLDYVAACAKEHHVLPHVRLGTEVVSATWDDERAVWRMVVRDQRGTSEVGATCATRTSEVRESDGTSEVRESDGTSEVEVHAIVSAVGMLNRPAVPDIDGLESFAGPTFHSSRWDHDVDLHDRRVVVIGTGASAMQFVPAIAPDARARHDLPAFAALGHPQPRLPPAGHRRGAVALPLGAALPLLVPGAAVLEQRRPHVPRVPQGSRVARPGRVHQPPERQAAPGDDRARRARARRHDPSWWPKCCPTTRPSASGCCRTTAGSGPSCATTSTW